MRQKKRDHVANLAKKQNLGLSIDEIYFRSDRHNLSIYIWVDIDKIGYLKDISLIFSNLRLVRLSTTERKTYSHGRRPPQTKFGAKCTS